MGLVLQGIRSQKFLVPLGILRRPIGATLDIFVSTLLRNWSFQSFVANTRLLR
jgi:hypothetical protein